MKLTVVGCSGSIPGPDAAASSYLVEHEGFRLVVDLGHGALGPLQRYVGIEEIDAVAISHLHTDHCIDLMALDVARAFGSYDVFGSLPVYGPMDLAERLWDESGAPDAPVKRTTFDFRDLRLTSEIGPFRIRTARMSHPGEAYAIRFDVDGASLVYSGDTGPCDALPELADGTDVLLVEASAVDGEQNPPNLHLTGVQAGEIATRSGVSHLVLTHIPPWNSTEVALAEAARTFSGTTSLATPGWTLEVSR